MPGTPQPSQAIGGTRLDLDDTGPEFVWMQPGDVAKAGIDGMVKGRRIVFPSVTHQAVGMAGRFAPRSVMLPLMERFGAPSGQLNRDDSLSRPKPIPINR